MAANGKVEENFVISYVFRLRRPSSIDFHVFFFFACRVLEAYPNGFKNANYFSLYLVVSASKTLPCGWKIRTKFSLTVVNQLSHKLSQRRGEFSKDWAKESSYICEFYFMCVCVCFELDQYYLFVVYRNRTMV